MGSSDPWAKVGCRRARQSAEVSASPATTTSATEATAPALAPTPSPPPPPAGDDHRTRQEAAEQTAGEHRERGAAEARLDALAQLVLEQPEIALRRWAGTHGGERSVAVEGAELEVDSEGPAIRLRTDAPVHDRHVGVEAA